MAFSSKHNRIINVECDLGGTERLTDTNGLTDVVATQAINTTQHTIHTIEKLSSLHNTLNWQWHYSGLLSWRFSCCWSWPPSNGTLTERWEHPSNLNLTVPSVFDLNILLAQKIGVPGPWGLPILYNASDVSKNLHRFYDWNFDCTMKVHHNLLVGSPRCALLLNVLLTIVQQYGKTWAFKLPTIPWNLVLIEPADVHHILKANFENYVKGPNFLASFEPLLGNGIFNINGSEWKQQRYISSTLLLVHQNTSNISVLSMPFLCVLNLMLAFIDKQPVICSKSKSSETW